MKTVTTSYAALELAILCGYFALLISVVFFSYRKQKSDTDFILGNRSLNFWLTALSAQASDMSGWLFLGYPALVFGNGVFAAWAAIGLILGMFLNWHFIAPRLRIATEQFGSLTLSSYFEKRFDDTSGRLRLISGLMSLLFFTIYISSGIISMGILIESLLGLNYYVGTIIGLFIVVSYVFLGGYRTVAWVDLFQGFFLLAVIVFIPIYLLMQIGGIHPVMQAISMKNLSNSLLPNFEVLTFWKILITAAGWGLGYFGQPHILTKFMGIRHASEMDKAKYVGISWLVIALGAATAVGLIGIFVFPQGLNDPQQVILSIVKTTLAPFFAGLVLCAILAASTNVMAAHILIVASNLSEDFYKRIYKNVSANKLLWTSRISVVFIGLIGLAIAFFRPSTIYQLVLYSWSGLGASFGPLVLLSLYMKTINKQGAFAGILLGGLTAAIWPYFDRLCQLGISSIIPGFIFSLIAIYVVSALTHRKKVLAA
jgi:sodium/proline symporter